MGLSVGRICWLSRTYVLLATSKHGLFHIGKANVTIDESNQMYHVTQVLADA